MRKEITTLECFASLIYFKKKNYLKQKEGQKRAQIK
jgi:hypothetical protein